MLQVWSFYKADILWLSGKRAEALKIAGTELKRRSYILLSNSFAGPFARWIALTHQERDNVSRARLLLENLVSELESYDALDQAEILLALRIVTSQEGIVDPSVESRLSERLLALPHAVRAQLGALSGIK